VNVTTSITAVGVRERETKAKEGERKREKGKKERKRDRERLNPYIVLLFSHFTTSASRLQGKILPYK
jgi:hypothetical protein